jgi:hypothetical protein
MAVTVGDISDRQERFDDGENGHYAYHVTSSGVLLILRPNASPQQDWGVVWEFSPHAWAKVQGTRYTRDTEDLSGAMGRPDPAPPASDRSVGNS